MSNDENREKNEEKAAVPVQPIIDMGSTVVKNSRGTIHCLTIVGQVEGHTLLPDNLKSTKYEHVLPLLAALEQNEQVDGVLLLLNTVGGDIEAGLAIAELAAVLLAHDPADGVGDVGLAGPVWSHDSGDVLAEIQYRLVGEAFEPLYLKCF